jgi:putative superfamily III holin-X
MRFRGRTESTGELASGIVEDAQRLVRLEIELAKTELKEMALRNAVAFGMLFVTATLVFVAVLVAVPVTLVLLGGHWWWGLVWIGAYLLVGIVLALIGVKMLKLKPQRTLDSMQETKEWFSDLTSSLGK